MKRLLILLVFFASQMAEAVPLPSFVVRPLLVEDEVLETEYRVEPISLFEGRFVKGYIYQDILESPKLDVSIKGQVIPLLKAFDDIIYPFFTSHIAPDKFAAHRDRKKIILLFDRITDNDIYRAFPKGHYKGYYSQLLKKRYGREIITIDCHQNSMATAKIILLHELTHLIRDQYNPNETRWLHEGLAKFSEFLFVNQISEEQLTAWRESGRQKLFASFLHLNPVDYFHVFFFTYYLYKHFGGLDLIKNLIISNHSGVSNIQSGLDLFKQYETDPFKKRFYSFKAAFINYHVALWANPHRNRFDSSGLWDLKLHGVVPNPFPNASIKRRQIGSKHTITLRPGEGLYLKTGRKLCVDMDSPTPVYTFMADFDNDDEAAIAQLRYQSKTRFVYSSKRSENSLILLNPSPDQIIGKISLKTCNL